MIVDDLDLERVARTKFEAGAPAGVDGDRPLSFAAAFKLVQPEAFLRDMMNPSAKCLLTIFSIITLTNPSH
jgi:hypothetical protein